MKHSSHLTFQYIIECWGTLLDAGMPDACNVEATRGTKKVNKQVERKIKNFKLD